MFSVVKKQSSFPLNVLKLMQLTNFEITKIQVQKRISF